MWIDRTEKPALDQAEALGRGYDETTVDVIADSGTEQALAYFASAGATDPARRPYHSYKVLVVVQSVAAGLDVARRLLMNGPPSARDSALRAADDLFVDGFRKLAPELPRRDAAAVEFHSNLIMAGSPATSPRATTSARCRSPRRRSMAPRSSFAPRKRCIESAAPADLPAARQRSPAGVRRCSRPSVSRH